MRRSLLLLPVLFVSLGSLACGTRGGHVDDGGGPPGDGGTGHDGGGTTTGAIRIAPADLVQDVAAGGSATIPYQAFITPAGGTEMEITGMVSWSSTVSALGSFTSNTFTSTAGLGGLTNIRAQMGSVSGTTTLTLRVSREILGPGAPPDAASMFGSGTDASAAPTLVYPLEGTMVPPNMEELEFHYMPGSSTLQDLHITAPAAELHIYIACPETVSGGCIYTPDHDTWTAIATAARGAGEIHYELRGASATGVGTSAPRAITFAQSDVTGGIYYWAAGAGQIKRFDFGVPGAVEETFLDQARASAGVCVGCHALSRDGSRISVGTDIPTTIFEAFDVTSRMRLFANGGGFPAQPMFASWAPDNSEIVQSGPAGLRFIDGTTGATIVDNVLGHGACMPDWGPDGEHIVYAGYTGVGGIDALSITSGSIRQADLVGGSTWVEGATLVASAGDNNYYPAYSPDGHYVVFMKSPTNMDSDVSGGATDAQLWVVRSDASGPATRLTNATSGIGDSWPKWNPSEFDEHGHTIFWLAWSSQRPYGLRYGAASIVQLWMTAFDTTRGADPTYPPFRLPFQNIGVGNHIPQWVTTIHRETCTTSMDCGGEFCIDGRCYEQPPLI